MYKRQFDLPKSHFFLFGPRGTGKSTLLKDQLSQAKYFNLLIERSYQKYLADPHVFYQEVQALEKGRWVVVDEIQRLPGLLNYVHQLIEEKKWKFAITGSSARKLRQGGVNLLGGRAIRKNLFPFLPEELGDDFSLEEALRFGTLPIIWTSDNKKEALRAYTETYLKEEIQAEALVKNLGGFSRFLKIASLMHAQTLNVTNIARDAEVARTTVNGFLEILEDTLIAFKLEAYESHMRVREKKHPKFYFIDSGVVRSLRKSFGPVEDFEKGVLFEGMVATLLRTYNEYREFYDEAFYWQPADAQKTEVDFLLRRGRELIAIEVKATDKLRNEHFSGLKAISRNSDVKRKLLVCWVDEPRKADDQIEILPFAEFNRQLVQNKI